LLQALGAGVPAVAYDVGGIAEPVRQFGAGRVVRPGDISGLTAAARELLEDAAALEAARAGARRARETLTWDAAAAAHVALSGTRVRQLLSAGQLPPPEFSRPEVAQILLAVAFVGIAAPKLLGDPTAVASFETIGFGQWFRYLTGACELAGAIGLLIPRLSGLAALGLVGVMVGATLTNLFLMPGMAPVAVVTVLLGVLFAVIARYRLPRTVATLRR